MSHHTRRDFFADVGRGMLVASVGSAVATDLGLAPTWAEEASKSLSFGKLEPLVALMEETSIDKLQPLLLDKLRSGQISGGRLVGQRPQVRRRGLRWVSHDDGARASLSDFARFVR